MRVLRKAQTPRESSIQKREKDSQDEVFEKSLPLERESSQAKWSDVTYILILDFYGFTNLAI